MWPRVQRSCINHSHGERESQKYCRDQVCERDMSFGSDKASRGFILYKNHGCFVNGPATSSSIRTLAVGAASLSTRTLIVPNRYWLSYFTFHIARWHAFTAAERFFLNPTALGFDNSYGTLVGWWRNLQYVLLWKIAADQAVSALYWSNVGSRATRKALKRSTAALFIMFLEGHRFFPIRNFVEQHWNSNNPVFLCTR